MPQPSRASFWDAIHATGDLSGLFVHCSESSVALLDLVHGSALSTCGHQLQGRTVLVATSDQLTAIATLIELDGVARRIVLCPPDLPLEHLPIVARTAAAEVVVTDRLDVSETHDVIRTNGKISPIVRQRFATELTEWILLTSGTTGKPKLVVHSLATLAGAIENRNPTPSSTVWSTFYDIRRYGGLQILLRAMFAGASMVLSSARETTVDFLARAGAHGVTHISGTPSHWRRALMTPAARSIDPEYIRISGEIADQAILNQLQSFYPQARISHAFASTEAGVAFEVKDGLTGFSSDVLENTPGVAMKVENGSLRIRSERTAIKYLNSGGRALRDDEGFVDTGDLLELRADRYYFIGRRDGVINVGGLKVHPEEVEGVINRHPQVRMSLVRTRKNPLTGALVVADVVLKAPSCNGNCDHRALQQDILVLCREALSSHKVPAVINFVPALAMAETGKLIRRHA